jgi:hypothetical protein
VPNIAVRVALVVFAAFVLASLAVGLRAVVLEDRADAVLERTGAGKASAADVSRAQHWFDEAAKLNPDREPDLKEARLLHEVGDDHEALGIATHVVVDEPDNIEAWYLILTTDPDAAHRRAALARMRRLNPYIEVVIGLRKCLHCPRVVHHR